MEPREVLEVRLQVLQEMGLVPKSARLNSEGQIVDPNGKPIDWAPRAGDTERQLMLQEVERKVQERVGGGGDDAGTAAAAGGAKPRGGASSSIGRNVLDVADERAARGRTPIRSQAGRAGEAELSRRETPGGMDPKVFDSLDPNLQAQLAEMLPSAASGSDVGGGFFGGGDEGVEVAFRTHDQEQSGPLKVGAMPRVGVPDGGVMAAPAQAGGQGRVPTEVYGGLSSAQQRFLPLIFKAAEQHGVAPAILFALLMHESRLNPNASSPANRNGTRDHGIAQINESTLNRLGKSVAWAKDPRNAIDYAARRLAGSINRYGSVDAALIEYNGGQGMADKFMESGRWPYSAAKDYVGGILKIAQTFDPNGIYESDMPAEEDMFPGASVALTNPADIKARADEVGVSVLGRNPNKREKKLLVAALQSAQKVSGMASATAQWVAQTGGSAEASQSFAQYGNGQIPKSVMAPIGGGHFLQPQAAAAYLQMKADAARDGVRITETDSYRDIHTQHRLAKEKGLYSQGGLAAKPGTSNHGWGLAVDVGDGPQRQWLARNAHRYGFSTIPREPWHWEYTGGGEHGTAEVGGMGVETFEQAPDMDALIEEELRAMNPEEAGATDIADAGQMLLAILGEGSLI